MITIIVCSIVATWIVGSALLVVTICMNSSRLSRIEEKDEELFAKIDELLKEKFDEN